MHFWSKFDPLPQFLLRGPKSKKKNFSHREKEGKSREKQGSIFPPLSRKNTITFYHFGYFLKETVCGHTFNGSNQNLSYPITVSLFLAHFV